MTTLNYVVNLKQQEKGMSGESIKSQPPFMVIERKHDGLTFPLK